jgi:hypothetical protein
MHADGDSSDSYETASDEDEQEYWRGRTAGGSSSTKANKEWERQEKKWEKRRRAQEVGLGLGWVTVQGDFPNGLPSGIQHRRWDKACFVSSRVQAVTK